MSSLLFLGFSIIAFILSYGVMFLVVPMTLGAFFTVADNIDILDASWAATYDETETTIQYLVPLIPTIGIFVLVIKILMVASVRGQN